MLQSFERNNDSTNNLTRSEVYGYRILISVSYIKFFLRYCKIDSFFWMLGIHLM